MATMPTVSSVSTATSSTMTTLSNLMSKFLDNVNAGKFVTDIGPGLALTVPLLMLIAVITGGQVVPLQQAPNLRTQFRAAYEEMEELHEAIAPKLPEPANTAFKTKKEKAKAPRAEKAHPADPLPSYWDWFDSKAPDALKVADKLISEAWNVLNADITDENKKKHRAQLDGKSSLEKDLARLAPLRAKLIDLQKAYLDATSVTKNLEGWESNLVLIAGLAVVLGVIVSQAARFLFFEILFRFPYLKQLRALRAMLDGKQQNAALQKQVEADDHRDAQQAKTALLKQRSPSFAAAYQDLVTNHLRYAEGSVNMAVPMLFLGWIYPCFAEPLLDNASSAGLCAVDVRSAAWFVAVCLIGSGWFTYLRFRAKERAWLEQNLDAVAASEAATAAAKSAAESEKSAEAAKNSAAEAKASAEAAKKPSSG